MTHKYRAESEQFLQCFKLHTYIYDPRVKSNPPLAKLSVGMRRRTQARARERRRIQVRSETRSSVKIPVVRRRRRTTFDCVLWSSPSVPLSRPVGQLEATRARRRSCLIAWSRGATHVTVRGRALASECAYSALAPRLIISRAWCDDKRGREATGDERRARSAADGIFLRISGSRHCVVYTRIYSVGFA